jgi:hypothetical protein
MRYVIMIICLLIISAYRSYDSKPPEVSLMPMQVVQFEETAVEASAVLNENNLTIRHHVKEKDVYVEVIIPGFNFSSPTQKKKVNGEGYVKLYLNEKQIDEIYQAAFIVKGLPAGKHNLKFELVQNDSTSYGINEEITVTIP